MKLRNKKTREIGWLYCDHISIPKKMTVFSEDKDLSANHWDYKSLAELNEEWEDYEEPKDFWFIDPEILIACESTDPLLCDKKVAIETMKQFGNYFETKEEAEKAVEKFKAWKRVKRDLVSLNWQRERDGSFSVWGEFKTGNTLRADVYLDIHSKDLDLLFGGEE